MKEDFIAFDPSSLYAEYKGGNTMPDGSLRTPDENKGAEPGDGGAKKKPNKQFNAREHTEKLSEAFDTSNQVAVSSESLSSLRTALIESGADQSKIVGMNSEEVIAESLRKHRGESALKADEIRKKLKVVTEEKMEALAKEEGAILVYADALPRIIIETTKRGEYIDDPAAAEAFFRGRGFEITVPKDKWKNWAVVRRWKWAAEHGAVELTGWTGKPKSTEIGKNLPAIRGGNGEIYWDEPLEMYVVKRVPNNEGRIEKRRVPVHVNLEEVVKRLLYLKEKGVDTENGETSMRDQYGILLTEYRGQIEEARMILADPENPKNYDILSQMSLAINELKSKYTLLGSEKLNLFQSIVSDDDEKIVEEARAHVDSKFRELEKRSKPEQLAALFRRIKDSASQVNSIQEGGIYGRADDYREIFDETVETEVDANPDFAELLKWKAQVYRQGFDLRFSDISSELPPNDWKESEKTVDGILRLLESSDFGEQQLSQKIQRAVQVVLRIPVDSLEGEEKERAIELRKQLTEKYESVIAINQFYSTMEHASMNPETVSKVVQGLKDNTFEVYFERFNKDVQGKHLSVNLLDAGMNIYMGRFHKERLLMNFVESWTKDRKIKGKTDEERAALESIQGELGDDYSVDNMKKAIGKWYRENTMLGLIKEQAEAVGLRKSEMVGNKREYKVEQANGNVELVATGGGLIEELVKNKEKWNLSDKQIIEMVDTGLVDQVVNNAHRLAWVMAWSDYDGIRVWDPNIDNPAGGKGRVSGYVYNQSTDFFYGRMVDHAWEFFIDESRGKVEKANYVMQDEMLGENGNLLPQNRTLVRFASDLLDEEQGINSDGLLNETAKEVIKRKTNSFKNIKKFDKGNKEEMGWAKSAILAEALDQGEVKFDNCKWSHFFRVDNSWKYRWIDLYGDRAAMMNFMSPEKPKLQHYLQQPNNAEFLQLFSLENFYSKREVRLQPMMKLVIPMHQRLGTYWKSWWGEVDNMPHADTETIIDLAVRSNRLNVKYKDWMKREYLGWGGLPGILPVRNARFLAEYADIYARMGVSESAKRIWWQGPLFGGSEFFRQGLKYVFAR